MGRGQVISIVVGIASLVDETSVAAFQVQGEVRQEVRGDSDWAVVVPVSRWRPEWRQAFIFTSCLAYIWA